MLASLFLVAFNLISRAASGEPLLPPQAYEALHKDPPTLPAGLVYDVEVTDPETHRPVASLPAAGEVVVRLAVTNETAAPMRFHFPTHEQASFAAREIKPFAFGLFVVPFERWRSSYFQVIDRRPSSLDLRPGQTRVYMSTWPMSDGRNSPLPAGTYAVSTQFAGVNLPAVRLEKPE